MITVCVATYNGEAYIGEQLRSILHSPLIGEVLVSDDGSTDRTLEIIKSLEDKRIHLLDGPRQGLTRNVEFLLRHATGEFIFLADQDDVWMPSKVEVMLSALHRGATLVISDCSVVDAQLRELSPSYFRLVGSRPGLLRNILKNSYLGCCMAFSRQLLQQILPFPQKVPAHDWWIGLVAEMFGTVHFVKVPLLMYRRHGANLSTASGRSAVSIADRLRRRIILMSCLFLIWQSHVRCHRSIGERTS